MESLAIIKNIRSISTNENKYFIAMQTCNEHKISGLNCGVQRNYASDILLRDTVLKISRK
jgi:hypothetical protein